MPASTRNNGRPTSVRRNTRSTASQPQSSLSGIGLSGGVEVFEDPAPYVSQQWSSPLKCSSLAAVYWGTSRLSDPKLNLLIDMEHDMSSVFIRLQAVIELRCRPSPTTILIHIPPDRIQHMSVFSGPRGIACRNTRTFLFQLSRPPYLVLPPELNESTAPYPDATNEVLNGFYNLASQVQFAFQAQVQPTDISLDQLQIMATGICNGDILTLSSKASTEGLYNGKGARVLEGSNLRQQSPPSLPNQENHPSLANPSTPQQARMLPYEHLPQQQQQPPRLPLQEQQPPRLPYIQENIPAPSRRRRHSRLSEVQSVDDLDGNLGTQPRSGDRNGMGRDLIMYLQDMETRMMEGISARVMEKMKDMEARMLEKGGKE